MKYLISAIAFFFAIPAGAQVTVDSSNFTITPNHNLIFQNADTTTVAIPVTGSQQNFDYSNMKDTLAPFTVSYQSDKMNPVVPGDDYSANGVIPFANKNVPIVQHFHEDASGFYAIGYSVDTTTIKVSGVTLEIPKQYVPFTPPEPRVTFPSRIGEALKTFHSKVVLRFFITGILYNHDSGTFQTNRTIDFLPVGDGTLTLPGARSFLTILVKEHIITYDTVRINNKFPSDLLLQGAGLHNGLASDFHRFVFIGPQNGDVFLAVETDSMDTHVSAAYYSKNATPNGGINSVSNNSDRTIASVFPNPTTGSFHFTNVGTQASRIQIFNNVGKSIIDMALENKSDFSISLPHNVTPGIYFYQVITLTGESEQGSFVVRR